MLTKTNSILVCQNDAIGDVVLSIPMCNILKYYQPSIRICFLGRTYTEAVIRLCDSIDIFINYDDIKEKPNSVNKLLFQSYNIDTALLIRTDKELADFIKNLDIKFRIGYIRYLKHVFTCNRFVFYSKTKINLHQGQSRIKFLSFLNVNYIPTEQEFHKWYGVLKIAPLLHQYKKLIDPGRINIILHPATTGNAPSWEINNYTKLISLLDKNKYKVFVSGTKKDKTLIAKMNIPAASSDVIDISGTQTLEQFISFISSVDIIIGGSTGPIHLGAAVGTNVLGMYPTEPRFRKAENWKPLGINARFIESDGVDLTNIKVDTVLNIINEFQCKKSSYSYNDKIKDVDFTSLLP